MADSTVLGRFKMKTAIQKALFVFLMAFITNGLFAEQKTGDVIFKEEISGRRERRFWMDTTGNGFEDMYISTSIGSVADSILNRYIIEGGQVIFEAPPINSYNPQSVTPAFILYIVMPDTENTPANLRGRKIHILEFFPDNADYFTFAAEERRLREGR